MKLALFICALLALVSCHTFAFDNEDWTLDKTDKNKDDIMDFFEGVFNFFNLSSPSEINECFCDTSAALYFRLLKRFDKILADTKERNSIHLHLEIAKISLLCHALKNTHDCILNTKDFSDLLDALAVDEKHPYELKTILYTYYQAHYSDLFEGFKPILDNLNTQSHQAAGEAFAAMLNDTVNTIKEEGLLHLAFAGFANGGAISLGINDPDDSLKCYDDKSSGLILEFIYRLALVVSEGSFKEAAMNAFKFMETDGLEILQKIPKEDIECEENSKDNHELTMKLGIDVMSEKFGDLYIRYINDNRLHYYMFMSSLKKAFEHRNMHHAGSIYWQFLEAVASSKHKIDN